MSHPLRNPVPTSDLMTDERSFTHLDEQGRPRMVDVGDKAVTRRIAVAEGHIRMAAETLAAIVTGETPKGNVLLIAQLAGITGAKQTPNLIPLCHSIPLSSVEVDVKPDDSLPGIRVTATATVDARTGVEMEALTAVTISLLTVYDMCKARDRGMSIENVRLLRKEGGRSGAWKAPPEG
jgi:cyclic pyranopterin phosphate synthase